MNTVSLNQFNVNNLIIGALETKSAKTGDAYKSASITYKYDDGRPASRLSISSVEPNEKFGNSVVFYNCKVQKIMKYGNKDVWTGDWQMVIPLFQNAAAPSKEELKFVDNLNKIRRQTALSLICEEDATEKDINKALEEVKDPIFYYMEYAKDSQGKPIINKSGKKKVLGIDKTKSPCLYVKLYNKREDDEKGKAGIKTKFTDSNYESIVPESLEGKLIDCVVELRFDSIYCGKGYSIQMKMGEVGVIRVRDLPPKKNSKLEGFMKFIKPETIKPISNDEEYEYEEVEVDE